MLGNVHIIVHTVQSGGQGEFPGNATKLRLNITLLQLLILRNSIVVSPDWS